MHHHTANLNLTHLPFLSHFLRRKDTCDASPAVGFSLCFLLKETCGEATALKATNPMNRWDRETVDASSLGLLKAGWMEP